MADDTPHARTKHLIRFEREIVAAIEVWIEAKQREMPGLKISFNQAVNVIAAQHLKVKL